ncbi:hypothetical protein HY213_02445 [Candidatus Peregrinibacteria bacterium]|nr:hypothetical protein [Candidatus Peregrinibacteria bacterium]
MPNPEHQNKFDVYDTYAGRCPPREEEKEVPRAEWVPASEIKERAAAIEQEVLEALQTCAGKTSFETMFTIEGAEAKKERQNETIFREPMKCDPSLTLDLTKIYTPSVNRHALTINILRPAATEIDEHFVANFNMTLRENNTIDIYHREVSPRYRGNHIFPAVMGSLKQFADRKNAERKKEDLQSPIRLRFECGQPELLARIMGQEFEAKDDEQRGRIERMLSVDPSLYADYSYYDQEGEWKREAGKLLYCYEGSREKSTFEDKNWEKSYRATVFYDSPPDEKDIRKTTNDTKAAIGELQIP